MTRQMDVAAHNHCPMMQANMMRQMDVVAAHNHCGQRLHIGSAVHSIDVNALPPVTVDLDKARNAGFAEMLERIFRQHPDIFARFFQDHPEVLMPSLEHFISKDVDRFRGVQGMPGPEGTIGLEGKQGPQGFEGKQGPQGLEGKQGPQGLEGKQGPQGPQGLEGKPGPEGKQGLEGKPGPEGKQGPEGKPGPAGPAGPAGPTGPPGPGGKQGPAGPAGPRGAPGEVVNVVKIALGDSSALTKRIAAITNGEVSAFLGDVSGSMGGASGVPGKNRIDLLKTYYKEQLDNPDFKMFCAWSTEQSYHSVANRA